MSDYVNVISFSRCKKKSLFLKLLYPFQLAFVKNPYFLSYCIQVLQPLSKIPTSWATVSVSFSLCQKSLFLKLLYPFQSAFVKNPYFLSYCIHVLQPLSKISISWATSSISISLCQKSLFLSYCTHFNQPLSKKSLFLKLCTVSTQFSLWQKSPFLELLLNFLRV